MNAAGVLVYNTIFHKLTETISNVWEKKDVYGKVCRQDGILQARWKINVHTLDIMPEVS